MWRWDGYLLIILLAVVESMLNIFLGRTNVVSSIRASIALVIFRVSSFSWITSVPISSANGQSSHGKDMILWIAIIAVSEGHRQITAQFLVRKEIEVVVELTNRV